MKEHHDYQLAIALVILGVVLLLMLASGVFVAVKYHSVIRNPFLSPTPNPILMMT